MHFVYQIFCLLRLFVTLFPQYGYIHPDEFFQGPEIIYGDILQLKIYKTWEFTSSKPVRSIIFPFLTTGFPCLVADLTGIFSSVFESYLYPYLLLVLPRLFMCCLSFINDILIYKTSKLGEQNASDCLLIFSSSYVTLSYLIRPLSNSLEMIFFSILLFMIYKHIKYYSFNNTYDKYNIYSSYKTYYIIGLLLVFGTFNRPTFLVYSLFPIFSLFFSSKKISFHKLVCNAIYFSFGVLSSLISICLLDTFYYNKWHYSKLNYDLVNLSQIVLTPLNFILYNANTENLSIHGLHPLYLHILVNFPLLFSVCGLYLIPLMFQYLKILLETPSIALDVKKYFFFYSLLIPLCLLSFIPHQEPRFLIPLFFPLLMLSQPMFRSKICKKLWFILNIVCFIFYGFIHQGGVNLSLSNLHGALQNSNNLAVVFCKTYMPPRFLLGVKKDGVSIYDFAGLGEQEFLVSLSNLEQNHHENIFVVVPFGLSNKLHKFTNIFKNHKMVESKYNFPHLSTELLPNLNDFQFLFNSNLSLTKKMHELKKVFSLHVLTYKKGENF